MSLLFHFWEINIINILFHSSLSQLDFVCAWASHNFTAKHVFSPILLRFAIRSLRYSHLDWQKQIEYWCIYTDFFPPNWNLQFLNHFRSFFKIPSSGMDVPLFFNDQSFEFCTQCSCETLIHIKNFHPKTDEESFYCYFRLH